MPASEWRRRVDRSGAEGPRPFPLTFPRWETPSSWPSPNFGEIFAAGPREILRSGAGLANLAASAYLGQCNRIQDRNLLASVLAIHTVEARHASWIRDINEADPAPQAFDAPLRKQQVLAAVADTRFIVPRRRRRSMRDGDVSPTFAG